jgi:diguanylate cyclase (GGDEF)-like protein/PAS domain S-box-containing protein
MYVGKCQAWLRASLHAATLAGLILIAACWGIAAFVTYVEHEKAIEGMHRQSDDMVRLFEQNTVEVLERIDRTLLLLRNTYEEDPKHFDLRSWATRTALLVDETFQITLLGVSGFQSASTTDYAGPPLYLGDREYFRKQLNLSIDKLFISEPVRGLASARLSLEFSRRVRAPDGGFGGVIVASIDPNFIGRYFQTINPGQTGSIILRNMNGVILAAQGVPSINIGRQVRPQNYLDALSRSSSGYYWGRSAFDDNRRLMAYRTTEKFPLVFAVGLAESDGLGDYQKIRTNYFVAAGILTLMILAAMAMNIRRQLIHDNSQGCLRLLNEEISKQNVRFDAALANMSNGLSMFDADGKLMVWNQRYVEIYGIAPDLIRRGVSIDTIIEHRKAEGNSREFAADGSASRFEEFADGRVILISRQPMKEGGWVATHEDITERRRAEAEIAHLARHDALTGLANRAEFNAKLAEASQRIQHYDSAVTVLMLDLDKFKAVNDTLGHPAGDQLLVEVGQRLQSTLRATDVLARLGGDEFAIIQEGGSHQQDGAIALAQKIIEVIAQPFDLNGHPAHIGSSIGIALAPEHGVDPEQLLTAADLALYDAKASGRNDFRIFQVAMLEVARTRKSAELELRAAIERHEFELHYQPVVDVKRHLLCGVEALVRWRHPTRGLFGPDQFIPLAESTGLIVPLGEWILQQACADAASLPEHIKVAVNVSAVQFRKGNLFNTASRILAEAGLSPQRLELEITETTHLENQEAHLATMRKLRNMGISMVLDDFGTGYSSINYLTSFPFDKLKIDKSFTQGALDRSDCAAVIACTLALAQGLGIVTTAEGVETEQQFEYMRKAGVDLVQGHLFGRPVPIEEFGLQTAKTVEMLCRVTKPRSDKSLRKRDGSKLRA